MRSVFANAFVLSLICTALICSDRSLQADIVWNESDHGDLSSSPDSPTVVNFAIGANTVVGSLSEPADDLRDYLTFTIGPNQFLTGLTLDVFTPAGVSFHAMNVGSTSFIPGDDPASNFLGLEFVFDGLVGFDLLPELAVGAYGSTGFATPLGPGTYSYLIQEITPGESRSYQLTFTVVPEPSSMGFLCLAGVLSAYRRRQRG
jgi:hypothetical protein